MFISTHIPYPSEVFFVEEGKGREKKISTYLEIYDVEDHRKGSWSEKMILPSLVPVFSPQSVGHLMFLRSLRKY